MPASNYEDSDPGSVYLATYPDVARSYAEVSEEVPEEWLEQIVVLEIDLPAEMAAQLQADPNVRAAGDTEPSTWVFRGVIGPDCIRSMSEDRESQTGELFPARMF